MATAETKLERPIRVGIFTDLSSADRAVRNLLDIGFGPQQISVLTTDEQVERHFAQFEHQHPAGTFTPAAAIAGTTIGAVIGGLSVAAAAAATGGAALLVTGGIAAWAGGVAGGLIGAMLTRGVEKEAANYYNQAVESGKILVVAEEHHAPERLLAAEKALADAGALPLPLREG